MLNIGPIEIPSRLVLAPLAGISDIPFRMICRKNGCEFAHIEMISARALVYQSRTTISMLRTIPEDSPLGVQLLGNDPEIMVKALERLPMDSFRLIDVNAACPVHKVIRRGEGAAIMKEPQRLNKVLAALVRHSPLPVTVKIRSGWDDGSVNAREIARIAEGAGVRGLTIHGRTRAQGYRGTVDYDVIQEVKRAVSIPVIASGDALSPRLIQKLFDETACDGVAVARGAMGKPWIFRDTVEYLETGSLHEQHAVTEVVATMKEHLDLCIDEHGEKRGTIQFRALFGWYVRGLPGNKPLKERAFRAKNHHEMTGIIEELLSSVQPVNTPKD